MMCFTASECQAQQQLEDKYNVEFSVDGGKTWKSRGMIVQDPSSRLNRLQFRSSLTSDAKWPKDLIQIISDRILSKKPENLMYQLRFRSPTNGEILAMNSISMCALISSKFKEVWHLQYDVKEHLISVSLHAENVPSIPYHARTCSDEVISSLQKLKNGLLQNGVRETVRVVTHNAPKTSEKVSFAGIKTPEEKRRELEQANEPGFFRKYWYLLVPAGLILLSSMFTGGGSE
ncbi:hypothetical protein FDP41_003089 [Naegleria fowleri]|uniref:ER membrane protein complex subunit 10 n=1 Tax=Naegleria fowleri TaxID=5763 RepID=A0A6A5BL87_NAEFO|nr:uncharacterized protein FDP41_003089 [Naegleria fowleri]KAF0977767.1 hypothetical protein FDP41_003089 [Naegleria fowleri]